MIDRRRLTGVYQSALQEMIRRFSDPRAREEQMLVARDYARNVGSYLVSLKVFANRHRSAAVRMVEMAWRSAHREN